MKDNRYQIVMIEDNLGDIELSRSVLEEIDIPLDLLDFHDGEIGLSELISRKEQVDLIFLDLNLPKYNGFEILLKLKKYQSLNAIPVIVFSTSKNSREILKAYQLGANAYMVKPNDFNEYKRVLLETCNYWLNNVSLSSTNEAL